MLTRELDENNDIFFEKGRSAFLRDSDRQGIDRTVQSLTTRFNFFLAEWFLDESAGFPWRQLVFVKPANIPLIQAAAKNKILSTYGVNQLTAFSMNFTPANRTLEIDFTANTIYGTLTDRIIVNG